MNSKKFIFNWELNSCAIAVGKNFQLCSIENAINFKLKTNHSGCFWGKFIRLTGAENYFSLYQVKE